MRGVQQPSVTVIMPVRNEATFIERSLGAVLAQDYSRELIQILVVDGMSDDGTRELVQQMIARWPEDDLTLIDNPEHIVSTGLNRALRDAKGEVIIRVDGHCEIAPDYVRQSVKTLQKTNAECVGGALKTVGDTLLAQAIALAQSAPFGVGGVAFRTGRVTGAYVDTLAFGAYRRGVFDRIGIFDEELVRNQDDEFNFRLMQAGGKIWLDPSIRSVYYSRTSLRRLWRQYYQYGLYKVRVIQKRRAVPSWRHLIPTAFVLALVLSSVLALVMLEWRWALVVAGPYILVNLAASLWGARNAWSVLPLVPLAFLILHLAYGLGFLAGLWRWRAHWRGASSVPKKFV